MTLDPRDLAIVAILVVALIVTSILLYRTSKELEKCMKGLDNE